MQNKDIYYETLYNYKNLSDEEIEENIKILAKDIRYSNKMFTQNVVLKGDWYLAARVLKERGYPMVADVIPEMFEWLQDWNWLGVEEIVSILYTIPKNILIKELEKVTLVAKKRNDTVWLYYLRQFMENKSFKEEDFNDKEIYIILKNALDD